MAIAAGEIVAGRAQVAVDRRGQTELSTRVFRERSVRLFHTRQSGRQLLHVAMLKSRFEVSLGGTGDRGPMLNPLAVILREVGWWCCGLSLSQ